MLNVLESETLPDRIESWKHKKNSKIEDLRKSMEAENLKECTFAPKVLFLNKVSVYLSFIMILK